MNRRAFLKLIGLGTAGAAAIGVTPSMLEGFVADPERLLWRPGERTLIMPPEKTFHLYSRSELEALERALGVIRFYTPKGYPRLTAFDGKSPHAVDQLKVLSDQEIRLAIDTGFDLDPRIPEPMLTGGMIDWRSGRSVQTVYTSHGHASTHLTEERARIIREDRRRLHQHGQDLFRGGAPGGGKYDGMITEAATDRGLIVIGDRDRKGR